MDKLTEQEALWSSEFGTEWTLRNQSNEKHQVDRQVYFTRLLKAYGALHSAIEFGSNQGDNLFALQHLYPSLSLTGVEINAKASEIAKTLVPQAHIITQSVLDYRDDAQYDLVFTRALLIHINPEHLNTAYDVLYRSSSRYILISEYYNPTPMEINYRGHTGVLFKRDFAGEMLDRFPQLSLRDYGFIYHRDTFPQNDLNWFLLEKTI